MAIDLEKLNIVIEGEATKATGAIDTLIIKLNGLKWSLSRLGDVSGNISSAFEGLTSSTQSAASQIGSVSDALDGTTKVGERTASATESVAEAQEEVAESAKKTAEALSEERKLFKDAKNAIARYYEILTKIKTFKSDVVEGDSGFKSASGNWKKLAAAANEAASRYADIQEYKQDLSDEHFEEVVEKEARAFENYNIRAEKVANSMKNVRRGTTGASGSIKELGRSANHASTGFGKLLGTIKRVATMRLIRWAIRQLVNTAKEGLEILVEWDRTFGNNTSYAAKTVDELSAKWREVKKSIGAAIMPLIQILQPVINFILNAVTWLANGLNQILRSAQGFSDYMKATEVNTKNTVGAAKELRRVLFGFDELNVLNGSGGTGASGSVYAIDFDPTPIESGWKKIGNFVKQVWENIKAGAEQAFGGIKKIAKGFKDGDWRLIMEGIQDVAVGVWNIITSEASLIWDKIKPYFEPIADWFDVRFGGLIRDLKSNFTETFTGIKQAVIALMMGIEYYILENHPTLAKILGISKESIERLKLAFDATTTKDKNTTAIESLVNTATSVSSLGIKLATKTQLDNNIKQVIGLVGSNLATIGMNIALTAGKFASGGDPDMGTLFWAGENGGAEVVATSPSGTGVMNMKQMQDAVSSGNVQVVNAIGAMTNILASAINNKDTNAYLDGQMITDNVLRRANGMARATGQPVLVR